MSKYTKLGEDNIKLFQERIDKYNLSNFMEFSFFHDEKMKITSDSFLGKVYKNTELSVVQGVPEVTIIVNEDIFDGLSDLHQIIAIDKLLAFVSYDTEKEKVIKTSPDFSEHSLIFEKYGTELLSLRSEISRLFSEKDESDS